MNGELPDVQSGFRQVRGTRDQIANICWVMQKARELQKKTSTCASLDYTKAFDCVDHNKLWRKFLKRCEYQTTLPVSWETCMWVKKQPLEPYMEQLTGSKLGKKYDKPLYCDPVCLTYMQITSCEIQSWINHKLESILLGEITTSDVQMIPL